MKSLVYGFSGVATAAFNLFNMYDRVNDTAVQVDRSNLLVKRSTEGLDQAQKTLTETIAKYGPNSAEAKDAQDKLAIATDALTVSTERADQAATAHNQALVSMGIQILPTLITMIGSVAMITANWTALQEALNAVMAINPIYLVVMAIAALVVGLIWAYQNCEIFRNAINAIGGAFVWFFNSVLVPFAKFLVGNLLSAWSALCSGMAWVYDNVLKPVFDALAWVWNNILKPIADFFSGGGGATMPGQPAGGGPTGEGPTHGQFGGIITKPTLLYAGEAGPEALIPLNQLGRGGGGASSPPEVTMNFNAPLVYVQGAADRNTANVAVQAVKESLKTVIVEASSSAADTTQKQIRIGDTMQVTASVSKFNFPPFMYAPWNRETG
jgi:hypothetical protein